MSHVENAFGKFLNYEYFPFTVASAPTALAFPVHHLIWCAFAGLWRWHWFGWGWALADLKRIGWTGTFPRRPLFSRSNRKFLARVSGSVGHGRGNRKQPMSTGKLLLWGMVAEPVKKLSLIGLWQGSSVEASMDLIPNYLEPQTWASDLQGLSQRALANHHLESGNHQ